MVGEIKSFGTGVVIVKTKYSKQDFNIKFNRVSEIIVERKALILLTGGRRRFGNIRTTEAGLVQITLTNGKVEEHPLNRVIGLQEVSDNFWARFKGNVDFGFNLTRANSNLQVNNSLRLDYTGERWISNLSSNYLRSTRTDAAPTERLDGNFELQRVLRKNWFIIASVGYLSNTEQALDSRVSPSFGGGRLLVSTNKLYWSASLGFTYNIERFTTDTPPRESAEGFIGTDLNLFDIKDFNLTTGIRFYPSLTERERFRTDYELALKYDLPWDLYIKLEFKFNYDNQPAAGGNEFDYLLTSGIGWKFNK